jgi:hypothetical protein
MFGVDVETLTCNAACRQQLYLALFSNTGQDGVQLVLQAVRGAAAFAAWLASQQNMLD